MMPANAQPIRAPRGLHPVPPLLGADGQRGAVRAALAAGVRAPRSAILQRLHACSSSARAVLLGRHDCPPARDRRRAFWLAVPPGAMETREARGSAARES